MKIIWLNGAYGCGKTTIAYELARSIENAFIYDPEQMGYFIRKNEPEELIADNFQDEPLWAEFNLKMIRHICNSNKTIIIPMTIYRKDIFEQIITQLRNDEIIVDHYLLSAKKTTIMQRLMKRLEGRNSWAASMIDECLAGFKDECFERKIVTDELNIDDIVSLIIKLSDLKTVNDTRSKYRKDFDRNMIAIKNRRF